MYYAGCYNFLWQYILLVKHVKMLRDQKGSSKSAHSWISFKLCTLYVQDQATTIIAFLLDQ